MAVTEQHVKRFFPLPDYDLSEPDRVGVMVRGKILDEQYSRLLMERADEEQGTQPSVRAVTEGTNPQCGIQGRFPMADHRSGL